MSDMAIGAVRGRAAIYEWVSFAFQVAIAVAFEVADDLARGLVSQHGSLEGVLNARKVVTFEAMHGLWIEPAWQMFFLRTRLLFDVDIDWTLTARAMNGIYVLGHVVVTLGVAIWVFRYRRPYFRLLRNTIICVNGLALIVYEAFPVAPPRMTSGLVFNHHTFHFVDTLFGIASKGQTVGTTVRYNEFSAMPSVHEAWALVAGLTLVILARPLLIRVFGGVYPFLMLVAIVVTGNHYLLDAVAAVGIVALAFAASLIFEWWRGSLRPPWRHEDTPKQGMVATPI
ncbi:MAG: hypothetical protein PVSMB7_27410 [Chloroflexota bacterium]